MKKAVSLICIILLTCIFILQLLPLSSAQISEDTIDYPVTVRLTVQVYEIDQEKRLANVSVIAYIVDYPENDSEIEVWISGAGYAIFNCSRGGQRTHGWSYSGASNKTVWSLEGDGELFPFDTYVMRFTIFEVGILNWENCTFVEEGHQAYFAGSQTYYLNNVWKRTNSLIPLTSVGDKEVIFTLQRQINSIFVAFLVFFVPIFACYYLLGSALVLDPKRHLAERLRIFLSIFFFVPSFFIAIQEFFPYRVSLSFPELLLINLLVSTAVLGVFSILGKQYEQSVETIIDRFYSPRISQRTLDLIGVFIASILLLAIYGVTLLGKINPILVIFFNYIIIPAYVFWIPLVNTNRYRITRKTLFALIIGVLFSLSLYLFAFLFNSVFVYIITFGGLVTGLIVGFYVRNTSRGMILALISGVLGTIIAGVIAGSLLGGIEGVFNSIQTFGVIGNLFGMYSLGGGLIAGLFLERRKK